MNTVKTGMALLGCAVLIGSGMPGADAAQLQSASGHGTQNDGQRQFSFNAKQNADGTVTGQAQLVNKAFSGASGPAPYRAHIEITCMRVVGNTAILGGRTTSTNDPNLDDAVFFTVQDNGEPGSGQDMISGANFFDDDPTTTGDPESCLVTEPDAFEMSPIEGGNIQVRPAG